MVFIFSKWELVASGLNFIAIGANYISFPQGSETSVLYLIERSDNRHGSSIVSEYESLIIYYTHPIIQFYNLSEFPHISEAILAITRGGIWAPKLLVKASILLWIWYRLSEVIGRP